ncbi:MFS general substrate transporter [Fragilariopsis cylindrus CCMP1102]|uniref:MFS general substrate transporter n=1 Tax=Fragilariopsis cylindrus CCMP1102 TaxID=635003 RepID=A0A1E7FKZ9_9STRA|nr:MFS general substrate transporter [Fragilariopsis cylindrus CCMP1102]|eukprot:OEU18849.1 MFS general substrate transporter [Fragilariopsis cylindrus CCMP1102]
MPLSNINAESNNDNNDDENDSVSEPKKESFLEQASSKALRPFVIISSSYLLYTITDGAIRMIVLLQAYKLNFSALEVAIMFSLYELAGVFTNLAAGVMGAKWGIKFTLICGLTLQLFAYGLLFAWNDDWPKKSAIIYVTFAQMFAGVAKDLTKLGGKTVTKLVTPEEQETKLFKLVSLITGWKNSLKGVGYFLGSALISINYELALGVMMGIVLLAMPWAILGLDKSLGTAKEKNASFREIFVLDNKNLNWLSLARLFLFASRDFWFEVPLPFFLRSPSCEGLGETQFLVGTILGGYIILYGQVQSWTPQTVTTPLSQTPPNKLTEILWGFVNCLPTLVMWIVMTWGPAFMNYEVTAMTTWIIAAVVAFAFIFAINSSIHSFLVVKYASKDKIAASVGFYYMSNACGRLFGTLGSGFLYSYVGEDYGDAAGNDAVAGLASCFLAGTICSLLAAAITFKIDDQQSGLKCGSCVTIIPSREEEPSSIMQEVIVVDGTDDHNVTLDDKKN